MEQVDRNGVVTWYHHDQLGSTRSLTNATGAVVGTATYDASLTSDPPEGIR